MHQFGSTMGRITEGEPALPALGPRLAAIRWPQSMVALVPLAASFLVYLRTLCPTVYALDSALLATSASVLGIVHANGYPTYLLIGKLFTWLPIGEVAFRINLMSAVFGAGTIALVYRIGARLTRDRPSALIAALALAFSYYFWSLSVIAEVYTLHTFFFALILELLLRWRESERPRLIVAATLLFALSLGNHLATVLLAPGFLAIALARRSALDRRTLALAAVVAAFGLLVYLYLPLRYLAGTPYNQAGFVDAAGRFMPLDLARWDGFWWMLTAQQFRGLMFGYSPADAVTEAGRVLGWVWGNFLGIGAAIGLLGLYRAFGAGRPGPILALLFLPNFVFFANYAVVDKETMLLPLYLVWALWLAFGLAKLRQMAERALGRAGRVPVVAVLALLPIAAVAVNFDRVDLSGDRRARIWAEAVMQTVEPDSYVFGWWTRTTLLRYLQETEGWRPDVRVIDRGQIGEAAMQQLVAAHLSRDPIYLLNYDPVWDRPYQLVAAGETYRLEARAEGP